MQMRLGLYNNKRNLRQTHLQRQHSRTHNNHLSIFRGARGVYVRAYMEYGIECNFPAQSLHSAHTLLYTPLSDCINAQDAAAAAAAHIYSLGEQCDLRAMSPDLITSYEMNERHSFNGMWH